MGRLRRIVGRTVLPVLHRFDIDARTGYRLTTDPVRQRLLERFGTTLVLDVGANAGHYGRKLRRHGYTGRIVSFEPLPAAYRQLCEATATDPAWDCRNVALGAAADVMTLHESANSVSSSLRHMQERHQDAAPRSRFVADHEVQVATLDALVDDLAAPEDVLFLKADVQGFEREVLDGATTTMSRVAGAELELSIVPLYDGAAGYLELIDRMTSTGFRLVWIERGFVDASRDELLQVDAIFVR